MENTKETKRKLEDIIDINQYIISKGIRKIYEEKLVLRENGQIQLNNTFIKTTQERAFAVAFSNDFKEVVLIPNCEQEIVFSKGGIARDTELVSKIGKKRLPFPMTYRLCWDADKMIWRGKLDITTKE